MTQTLPIPAAPPLSPEAASEIAALARRQLRAGGPLIALLNRFGGTVEAQLSRLPQGVRGRLEGATRAALDQAFSAARLGRHAPDLGPRAAPALAALSGAAGGAGGLATSLAELPVTVTLILHSIARAAEAEGFDPDDGWVRAECLRIFASGSPTADDDGINTALMGARMALSGPALQRMIATVAPKLAATLGQKLAAQAVPVLGAVSGAAINAAFLGHYRELAQIRFAVLRLAGTHGAEPVLAAFRKATTDEPLLRA
jgi:hypothetical protein